MAVEHDALVGTTATDLASAVRSGRTSATEVVTAHLDQIAAVEHRLGAYVTVLRREALAAAEAVDAHPDRADLPLAGVPVAIKDVVAVAGQPVRHGSLATSDTPFDADDEVVARWRAAGAVVIGITRGPELSLWGTTDGSGGTTVGPWLPSHTAGGSSGGSAAAVAGGTVPLALASDGLGSIRIPAAACGLVGIKPGGDLVPVCLPDGSRHWFGMSRFGPVATSVADAAAGLAVLADRPDLAEVAAPTDRLRVAVSWAPPLPGSVLTRPYVDAVVEAGRILRAAGHAVAHDDPPYEPATVAAVLLRWTQGAAADVDQLVVDPAALQPRTRAHAAAGAWLARRFPVRDRQALRWHDRVDRFLDRYDVVLTPMFAKVQPRAVAWHRRAWLANVAANLTAFPMTAAWNRGAGTRPAGACPTDRCVRAWGVRG